MMHNGSVEATRVDGGHRVTSEGGSCVDKTGRGGQGSEPGERRDRTFEQLRKVFYFKDEMKKHLRDKEERAVI